ncbi:hypothetical protein ACFV9E_42015, partial [Streptomyces sp. NPDC059835]|uniref:hypothetical protein n=1 Tax=Streptomyces sp. NPDC059835 TaxID=3346967 RepID=UPI00364B280E
MAAFNENAGGINIGYSVSHDGGRTWVDMGNLPRSPDVQPDADPRLAIDPAGNIWLTALADSDSGIVKLALYEMPAGSDTFRLVSLPAVGSAPGYQFEPDRERLAIARDGDGRTHFYVTYTQYQGSPGAIRGPVVLADSTDAKHWRHTTLTEPDLCEPHSPAAAPIAKGNRLYVFFHDLDKAACAHDPDVDPAVTGGREEVVTVDVETARILRRTVIAPIHGVGERVDLDCFGQQVISTASGLAGRTSSGSDPTLGPDGVLYVVWPDRPGGLGGGFDNATRIYLSHSR